VDKLALDSLPCCKVFDLILVVFCFERGLVGTDIWICAEVEDGGRGLLVAAGIFKSWLQFRWVGVRIWGGVSFLPAWLDSVPCSTCGDRVLGWPVVSGVGALVMVDEWRELGQCEVGSWVGFCFWLSVFPSWMVGEVG